MIVEGKLKAKAARTMIKKNVASGFFGFPVIVIYLRRFSGLSTQSKFLVYDFISFLLCYHDEHYHFSLI